MSRGAIYNQQAYAQGKMLDHSQWNLPRLITPSDIDVVFANGTSMLLCEFSSQHSGWADIQYGQRKLYADCVSASGGDMVAVLVRHSVPSSRVICSATDCDTFQLMYQHKNSDELGISEIFVSGTLNRWKLFVEGWFVSRAEAWKATTLPDSTACDRIQP